MELGEYSDWYLIKIGNDFGVQYYGDTPDEDFPQGLSGWSDTFATDGL
jgi:hypothetical protein